MRPARLRLNCAWFGLLVSLVLPFAIGAAESDDAKTRALARVQVTDGQGEPSYLYKESHALLVGISDYSEGWPDLEGVPRDLRQVEEVLEGQGFVVTPHLNLSGADLKHVFESFILAHGLDPENRLLFFFAGHGYTRAGGEKGYLVPADAPDPRRNVHGFLRKSLAMSQILAWARQIEAKHALFLFDSCFSGTVFKARALPSAPPNISRSTRLPVRQFITAGNAGEPVPASSVFTPVFVDALRYAWGDLNGDGYVTGTELGLHLQDKVPLHTQQTPQYGKISDYKLSRGDFVFMTPGASGERGGAIARAGQLNITTVPAGARVFVNGQSRGSAPLRLAELATGEVRVRVEAEGYEPKEEVVQVRPSREIELIVSLNRSLRAKLVREKVGYALTVDTSPVGARVRILNIKPRYRPGIPLPPGSYHIEVTQAGYKPYKEWIRVEDGDRTLSITLEREDRAEQLASHMIRVPGGCFEMGSAAGEPGRRQDEKRHRVCLETFGISGHEVTVGEFRRFVAATGYVTDAERGLGGDRGCVAYDKGEWQWHASANWRDPVFRQADSHPVVCVSWNDARAYVTWLSEQTGKAYRVPTEAEWEYAARAGERTARFWGDDPDAACTYANVHDLTSKLENGIGGAHHDCEDGYAQTAPVGRFRANGYGLHDVLGNVWEWTCSEYGGSYGGEEKQCSSQDEKTGRRVWRGGSWFNEPRFARSADRFRYKPFYRSAALGFRVAQDL